MKQPQEGSFRAFDLRGKEEAISQIAQSEDALQLLQLLQQGGDVEQAAKAAAKGDPGELIGRMQKLMKTDEGASLVERISRQVKEHGLAK